MDFLSGGKGSVEGFPMEPSQPNTEGMKGENHHYNDRVVTVQAAFRDKCYSQWQKS